MLRFVGAAAALAIVAVIVMASDSLPAVVQAGPGGPVVSVDAISAGNTATIVGTINASRSTTCGATFDVDVVIQGVTDIAGFQADLLYNPAVLMVTAVNYNFRLTTTGTAVLDLGNPTPDADGLFRMAAAMFSTEPFTGASGNGVLARVTLQAFGSGSSALNLTSVKMAHADASPIPPTDASGFYIGPVNDASISVTGSPCAVGGIAELPNVAGTALEAGDSSGSSAGRIGAVAAAASAGALVLGGAAWHARKRWLR